MKTRKNRNFGSFAQPKALNSRRYKDTLKGCKKESERYWIGVNLPKKQVDTKRMMLTFTRNHYDKLDDLVSRGIYSSKAEVVREALREFFRRRETNPRGDEKDE